MMAVMFTPIVVTIPAVVMTIVMAAHVGTSLKDSCGWGAGGR